MACIGYLEHPFNKNLLSRSETDSIIISDKALTSRLRTPQEIEQWFDGVHPVIVLETDEQQVIAFASTSVYRPRPCYAGIAEFSVYVERAWRVRGAGRQALQGLLRFSEQAGFWKLVS